MRLIHVLIDQDKDTVKILYWIEKFKKLTPIEYEVLCWAAMGLTHKAIALRIDRHWTTISNHKARIRDKLEVSTTRAVYWLGRVLQYSERSLDGLRIESGGVGE